MTDAVMSIALFVPRLAWVEVRELAQVDEIAGSHAWSEDSPNQTFCPCWTLANRSCCFKFLSGSQAATDLPGWGLTCFPWVGVPTHGRTPQTP